MIYKIFGFPVFYGNIKTKVAKKYLTSPIRWIMKNCREFENMGIGSLVHDCSGFNTRIIKMEPGYSKIINGYILDDIEIETGNGYCSLVHCGIDIGSLFSQDRIEKRYMGFIEDWYLNPLNNLMATVIKHDPLPDFVRKRYDALKNNQHIVDEQGVLLEGFKPIFQLEI